MGERYGSGKYGVVLGTRKGVVNKRLRDELDTLMAETHPTDIKREIICPALAVVIEDFDAFIEDFKGLKGETAETRKAMGGAQKAFTLMGCKAR